MIKTNSKKISVFNKINKTPVDDFTPNKLAIIGTTNKPMPPNPVLAIPIPIAQNAT